MAKVNQGGSKEIDGKLRQLKDAIDAFQHASAERTISAMEVVISYVARLGRMEHHMRGEEHYFRTTYRVADGSDSERWEDRVLNAYAIRDQFLKIKDWSGALEFLGKTGVFSPIDDSISWSKFQKWQRFVSMVQEHDELTAAMQSNDWDGECGEVLKALTGIYESKFFEEPSPSLTPLEEKWLTDPKVRAMVKQGEQFGRQKFKELCAWFREPPGDACSIQWVPKREEDRKRVLLQLGRGGAMIEFLLSQNALQPIFLIRPSTTIQAIAAAIYGDRIHGVEYRRCEMCKSLFPLGAHKEKKYCERSSCKNRAHQKNRRANLKKKIANQRTTVARKGKKK